MNDTTFQRCFEESFANPSDFSRFLRFFRNSMIETPSCQDSFRDCGFLTKVSSFLKSSNESSRNIQNHWLSVQTLGNAIVKNPRSQQVLWEVFFPEIFVVSRNDRSICRPLLCLRINLLILQKLLILGQGSSKLFNSTMLVLYNCIHGDSGKIIQVVCST